MYSYSGKCLVVDLTTQSTRLEELSESLLSSYLGGVGLGTRLLLEKCPPGAGPLSPDNPLVFASSGLAGTMVPTASKHAVVTKSPLTGLVGDSLSSSHWSLALKRAGYDAMVITGMAPSWVYLFIDDDIVHSRKAEHLLGKGSSQTEEAIRRDAGDNRVRVASIGPGGERLVRYACISNDSSRQAGRTGTGAVMGSKRLKAIAIRGTRPISVWDLDGLQKVCSDLYARSQTSSTEKYRILGTPGNVLVLNRLSALPTRNFQQASFEGAEGISGEHLAECYLAKVTACATCPIACEHLYRVQEGPYAGLEMMLDYESLFALGPLCGISSVPAVLKAAELCDFYGIDTISTGGCIAWAMECFEKGLLTANDTQGLDLSFGNPDALVTMVERIGKREGVGDLLAEGTMRASAQLKGGSEHWAIHSKGLELPGYDPRSMKTQALGFAVGLRGGCHNRSPSYEVDMSPGVDRLKAEPGRGLLNKEKEDFAAVLDSLIICKFMRRCFDDFFAEASRLYTLATGIKMGPAGLKQVGERVNNLKKAFNIREGWTQADDWLPPRMFKDPIPSGEATGAVLSEGELRMMIDAYYKARGWTASGLIPLSKLKELGMDDVVELMKGQRNGAQVHPLRG